MTETLLSLSAIAIGAVGTWFLQRQEIRYLRSEHQKATDRLVAAWKDGAVVPTREAIEPVEPTPDLSPGVRRFIEDFESAEGRATVEARARELQSMGSQEGEILITLQRETNPG